MKLPQGFASSATAAGIKPSGEPDLAVIVAEVPVSWAGTFTRNAAAAATVLWCRDQLGHKVRAIVCNSGNANACTGPSGIAAVEAISARAATAIGCAPGEVLVASTGPIGVELPVELVTTALPGMIDASGDSVDGFARAILTTDTTVKVSKAMAGGATVMGVAKGAAMLAPNMATMLAFITTDAAADDLQTVLDNAVEVSFNRISVDACESTNDSVFLLAGGSVQVSRGELQRAVTEVCRDLAEQMVRDAEGGSKFVRIQVSGTADDRAACDLGRAVAASALWRAALNGGDPNWGRVLSAMGSADRQLELGSVSISIGPETIFDKGQPSGSLGAARKAMDSDEVTLSCVVGTGPGSAEVLSSDLSTSYVSLNAQGST
jgi:glutamate N-acetyltransferase/amino-acid N-acetyltransferase